MKVINERKKRNKRTLKYNVVTSDGTEYKCSSITEVTDIVRESIGSSTMMTIIKLD